MFYLYVFPLYILCLSLSGLFKSIKIEINNARMFLFTIDQTSCKIIRLCTHHDSFELGKFNRSSSVQRSCFLLQFVHGFSPTLKIQRVILKVSFSSVFFDLAGVNLVLFTSFLSIVLR